MRGQLLVERERLQRTVRLGVFEVYLVATLMPKSSCRCGLARRTLTGPGTSTPVSSCSGPSDAVPVSTVAPRVSPRCCVRRRYHRR